MTTKIDNTFRSKVMKAAHKIFAKSYKNHTLANWSKALKRAWKWAKENLIKSDPRILGEVIRETAKAIQIEADVYCHVRGSIFKKIWLPKSQVKEILEDRVIVSAWIKSQKEAELHRSCSFM